MLTSKMVMDDPVLGLQQDTVSCRRCPLWPTCVFLSSANSRLESPSRSL